MLKRVVFALFVCVFLVISGAVVWSTCHNTVGCEDLPGDLVSDKYWGVWTVKFLVNVKYHSEKPPLTADVKSAAAKWSNIQAEGETLSFKFKYAGTTELLTDSVDDKNVIAYGPLDADTVARSYITPKPNSNEIRECDMRFNYYKDWELHKANFPDNEYCILNIACHEFGHWIGLNHVTASQCSAYYHYTMYKYTLPGEHRFESLECEDKWGAWYIYGAG